jgi:hypothetical protein
MQLLSSSVAGQDGQAVGVGAAAHDDGAQQVPASMQAAGSAPAAAAGAADMMQLDAPPAPAAAAAGQLGEEDHGGDAVAGEEG